MANPRRTAGVAFAEKNGGIWLDVNPGSVSILISMAEILFQQRKYDSTVLVAREVINQTPFLVSGVKSVHILAQLLLLCNPQLCAPCPPIFGYLFSCRHNRFFRDNPVNVLLFILLKAALNQSVLKAVIANDRYITISV